MSSAPNCVKCEHFFVTWEQPNSKGCRVYGFKSPDYPSIVVLQTSGSPCQAFKEKITGKEREEENND